MACGYAKFTGRLGVCLATSGPGGIHLLNGLYDAKLDGAPVLAITGLRYPVEAGLVGDSAVVIDALLPQLRPKEDRRFLEAAQKEMQAWRELMVERGTRRDSPMKPQVVTHELDALLAPDAIVTTDSGTVTTWVARHVTMRPGMLFSCSGNLATIACGLSYAIAATVAYPGRQVVAVIGDGALTMLMGELATIVTHGLDVKVIVIKNNSLGQIKWEQMVFLGNPEYGCALHPVDFSMAANAFGMPGVLIEDAASCGAQLREAMARPGPVLVEAVVDTQEPPMATLDQATQLAKALASGTPAGGKIARRIGLDVVREMI